jgi:hypothetical protein
LSGIALGLDVMTRATIAPFAALAPFGLAWLGERSRGQRLRSALWCSLALATVVTPWLVRSYRLTGAVTLSTETGFELWNGNNENTFSAYPKESIDLNLWASTLTPDEWATLERSGVIAVERWYADTALQYIRKHPWLSFYRSLRKLGAAFGLLMSPRHNLLENTAHALSYGPVMVLGLWGMWMRRRQWREDAIIYMLFAAFVAVTAVFFGHTSHRAYLDVYWIAFAAGTFERIAKRVGLMSHFLPGSLNRHARI